MEGAGVFRPLKIGLSDRGFSHGHFPCPAEASYVSQEAKKYPSGAKALCKFPSIQGSKDPCSLRYEQVTGRLGNCEQALGRNQARSPPTADRSSPRSDIPEIMRGVFPRPVALILCAAIAAALPVCAQEPDPFRWMDFHSQKDQDVIVWVTRSLAVENWTAIREIGVQYDAALVVTTNRATPQSSPDADTRGASSEVTP